MAAIGLFSDSGGDLQLFDQALRLLASKGARRFMFAGGRYEDLDDYVRWKRDGVKAQNDYTSENFLEDVSRFLIGLDQVDRPAAFGTVYELARAAEELAQLADKVVRTPEKGSLPYKDPAVPKKAMDMLGDAICCVVYDKNDLDKEDMLNSLVLVHGNEAEPKVVQIGPRFFVTPGKLSGSKTPTVALLDQVEKQVTFSAWTLDGKALITNQPLQQQSKTKLTVK